MATWAELSLDAYGAAQELKKAQRTRSSMSRAYYAAYCAVTEQLGDGQKAFKHGFRNPAHEQLPGLVANFALKPRTKQDVLTAIREQLKKARLNGIRFELVPDELKKSNGEWQVPVKLSAAPPSVFQYYEVLADVEAEIQERHGLNVWFIPELPA